MVQCGGNVEARVNSVLSTPKLFQYHPILPTASLTCALKGQNLETVSSGATADNANAPLLLPVIAWRT